MQSTCLYKAVGRLMILVHSEDDVLPSEWGDLQRIAEDNFRKPATEHFQGYLIVTDGGKPSSAQRAIMAEYWQGKKPPKFAVVSDSVVIRGVVTAFNWLNIQDMRAYPLARITEAFGYVGVSEREHHALLQDVLEMRALLHRLRSHK